MSKWKTINKKVVFENKFIKIREDEVIDPNGNKNIRNLIEVGSGSVIIIAVNQNNELIMIGQERYAVNEYSIEFVSGGIKNNENPLNAAKRELAEELNLNAKNWKQILVFHPSNSLMNRTAYVFLAKGLEKSKENFSKDDYEKLDYKTYKIKEVEKMIKDGEIKDSFTICSFYAYIQHNKGKKNEPCRKIFETRSISFR